MKKLLMVSSTSSLRERVYQATRQIPRGRVVSYKQLALTCGIKNPRIIGHFLHSNPDPKNIPCHRVVCSDGTIAAGYAFGGRNGQVAKLRKEGVVIKNNRVTAEYFYV